VSGVVLLVYGDSLSLPRAQGGVSCLDTYPELLRETLAGALRAAVLNRSRAGTSIGALYGQFVSDSVYFGGEARHLLVIQCGIVDCAPRPVAPSVKNRIARLPTPLRWAIARLLHYTRPYLLRAGLVWRNTEEAPFEQVLSDWLTRGERIAHSICVINIAPTTAATDAHSPGLAASIDRYNALIARVVAAPRRVPVHLIDVHRAISQRPDGLRECIDADGHHITLAGHRLYADLLAHATEQHSATQVPA
jgi:lysophospholipase L1-like esterase